MRVCVCNLWSHKVPDRMFICILSRGVRHSYPNTRNEAVDKSGKGNLASFLYLRFELLAKLRLHSPVKRY